MHHAIIHGHHKKQIFLRIPARTVKTHPILNKAIPHAIGSVILPVKRRLHHHQLSAGDHVIFSVHPRNTKLISFSLYILPLLMLLMSIGLGLVLNIPPEINMMLGLILFAAGILIFRILEKDYAFHRQFNIIIHGHHHKVN